MLPIERPVFDAVTAMGMGLLALGMSVAWSRQFARHHRAYLPHVLVALVLLWLGSLAGDVSGWFRRVDALPPPFVLTVFMCLGLVAMAGFGKVGAHLAQTMSIQTLVALQIFRLPLELLMLRAATLSIMPVEFSMQGYNLDVLTGAGALALRVYMALARRPSLKPGACVERAGHRLSAGHRRAGRAHLSLCACLWRHAGACEHLDPVFPLFAAADGAGQRCSVGPHRVEPQAAVDGRAKRPVS
jgi:hypothetical protein